MLRSTIVLSVMWACAPALAQQAIPMPGGAQPGTVACEPEVATLTIEIPTGRCAASLPAAEPVPIPPTVELAPPVWSYPSYAPVMPYAPVIEPYQAPAAAQVERSIRPLWIVGTALWVATWVADWTVTSISGEPETLRALAYVPLAGPWIQLALGQGEDGPGQAMLALDGLAQAAALIMIVVGALSRRQGRARRPRVEMDGTLMRF